MPDLKSPYIPYTQKPWPTLLSEIELYYTALSHVKVDQLDKKKNRKGKL